MIRTGTALSRFAARPAVLGLVGLVAFGAVLEVVPRIGLVPAAYAPPASRIAEALVAQVRRPEFWAALTDTLRTWLTGLAIAVVAGLVVGVAIGSVSVLRAATASTIEFLRPIPSVALIPLAVLLYGTGMRATLLLVVYAAFWQVLVQVLHGVADVDPVARDTARSYGLGRLAQIRFLVWPTALPYTITGVRLATSVALVLAVTGELVIGTPGLGREIAIAQTSNAVPAMYALVVVTGLLGVTANLLARTAERRVLAWHPAVRSEAVTP
ncbi:MAG TPA: ABC transporter permease subunit [Pilimelia sp.]|nr:ABC transporter permease subunit [Pilimelia sp.]